MFMFSLPHEFLEQLVEFVYQSLNGSRKKFHIWFYNCNVDGFIGFISSGSSVSVSRSLNPMISPFFHGFESTAWRNTPSTTCGGGVGISFSVTEGNTSAITGRCLQRKCNW